MEYEKIEEILSKFEKEIAYLNINTNDLYALVGKIKNDKNVSYLMWCLNFLSRGLDEIIASVLFMELLVKDMNKETNNG